MTSLVKGTLDGSQKLKGTVVLVQKNVLSFNAPAAAQSFGGIIRRAIDATNNSDIDDSIVDTATSFLENSVALRLISATKDDGNNFVISLYYIYTNLKNTFFSL